MANSLLLKYYSISNMSGGIFTSLLDSFYFCVFNAHFVHFFKLHMPFLDVSLDRSMLFLITAVLFCNFPLPVR